MKKFMKNFWRGAVLAIPTFILVLIGALPLLATKFDSVNDWLALISIITVPTAAGVAIAVGEVIADAMKAKEEK